MPSRFPPSLVTLSRCTVSERVVLLPLIARFHGYAKQGRNHGALALEEHCEGAHPVLHPSSVAGSEFQGQ